MGSSRISHRSGRLVTRRPVLWLSSGRKCSSPNSCPLGSSGTAVQVYSAITYGCRVHQVPVAPTLSRAPACQATWEWSWLLRYRVGTFPGSRNRRLFNALSSRESMRPFHR